MACTKDPSPSLSISLSLSHSHSLPLLLSHSQLTQRLNSKKTKHFSIYLELAIAVAYWKVHIEEVLAVRIREETGYRKIKSKG